MDHRNTLPHAGRFLLDLCLLPTQGLSFWPPVLASHPSTLCGLYSDLLVSLLDLLSDQGSTLSLWMNTSWREILSDLRRTGHRLTTAITLTNDQERNWRLNCKTPQTQDLQRRQYEESLMPCRWGWPLWFRVGPLETPVWHHFLACNLRQIS